MDMAVGKEIGKRHVREGNPVEAGRNTLDRHFRVLVLGVLCVSVVTQVVDVRLVPPLYNGILVRRSFCGLHSWARANRAWAARNHIKYGLDYTKGYHTPAVGDPPPAFPQRYVSHPPLESYIRAFGMLLFGMEDWSVRLFDLVLSVPALLLILFLLRRLYGRTLALLSGLLLVMLPLSGYFRTPGVTSQLLTI